MFKQSSPLLRHLSHPSNASFNGDDDSNLSGKKSPRLSDFDDGDESSITFRTSNNIFRRNKIQFLTGRDILTETETGKNNVTSSCDQGNTTSSTKKNKASKSRRRQPPPDGYLYDVSKTKKTQQGNVKKKSTAPPRIALDRGNHYQVKRDISSLTEKDLLYDGLRFVGYDETSMKQVKVDENVARFKSFYGVAPSTLLPFMKDLKNEHPNIDYRNVMMTCNFLKGDEVKRCMEPRWGRNKTYIGKTVRQYTKMFASLKYLKIKMEFDDGDKNIIVYTVDGVNFATSEFRKDPSSKWFDHKSHNR